MQKYVISRFFTPVFLVHMSVLMLSIVFSFYAQVSIRNQADLYGEIYDLKVKIDSMRGMLILNGFNVTESDSAQGYYSAGLVVTFADRIGTPERVAEVCMHETGHYVMDNFMSYEDRVVWSDVYVNLSDGNGSFVTNYSRTNYKELFAEHYMSCMLAGGYHG